MPDERDTQTAAPSYDGENSQSSQATATQEPPESPASTAAAGEAPASPAPDPQPKTDASAEAEGPKAEPATSSEPSPEAEPSEQPDEDAPAASPQAATTEVKDEPDTGEATPAAAEVKPDADEEPSAEGSGAETAEEPKAEAATEEPKAEAATEEPKVEAAAEEPKPEAATDEPKAEAAAEEPKAEAAAEEPKVEAAEDPKAEAAEEAKAEAAPVSEAPAQATPVETAEEPKAEAAEAEKPQTETAKTEAAKTEADTAEATPAATTEAAPAAEAKPAPEGEAKAEDEERPPELDDPTLQELRKAKEEGTTVTGKVIGWNRGGFHVVIDEVTAFCPASEMELGRPRSPDTYMDREMDFKVAKFQRRGRRVVLSRSEVLKTQRDEILANLKPGTVVKGTVTSLPEFGAFVDLGGVEGLVHVSEISRARVKRPGDVLKMGQEVEVKILKIEQGGDRISLSMKELEPDPWKDIANKYPRGSKFTGKVLRHADFGMFVELEPDVEGLVHVSQLEPGQEMSDETLQPGKTIEGWIREVEPKRERISLSLREVPDEDPWKTVQTRFPEGDTAKGTVESIAPFGVFIHLAPGLTGLLPNSQTGLPRGTSAARAFRPGQEVEIQVLSIDTRRKRISLGKPGSRVEATKADLQEWRKSQKEQEQKAAPSAMEAAFARLGLSTEGEEEQE